MPYVGAAMADTLISPARVAKDSVLAKCDYFVDIQLWPIESRMNPMRWLENFEQSEMDHAVHLLSAFTYYSGTLVKELFKAAFQSISRIVVPTDVPYIKGEAMWQQFGQHALVTFVTGETPHETDSGRLFARLARQELGVPEVNIRNPTEVLTALLAEGPRPVVFVDDFVGSGDQFITTWHREMQLASGETTSFERVSGLRGSEFYYCPLVCTELGRTAIQNGCAAVRVCPAQVLFERYSALSSDSIVWPERLRPTAKEFIVTASNRAGISESQCGGYRGLGLTLAFEHSVPDATLPLFYKEDNGWHPLVRKT